MFRRTHITAAMSQELMDEFTDHGRRDLSQLRMDDLETGERGVRTGGRIRGRAARGMLAEQVHSCKMSHCPQCGRELKNKPPQKKRPTVDRGDPRIVREVGSVDEGRSLSPRLHRRWRKSLRRRRPLEQLANPTNVFLGLHAGPRSAARFVLCIASRSSGNRPHGRLLAA